MTTLIEGKTVAQKIFDNLAHEISLLEKKPSLAVIIVGDDPASKIYVNLKKKKAHELGITSQVIELDESVSEQELLKKIDSLNNDQAVNAILLQMPLPEHINPVHVN